MAEYKGERHDEQRCGCFVCDDLETHYCSVHAAAPEMLEALINLQTWALDSDMPTLPYWIRSIDKINKAIEKAKEGS